MDKVIIDGVDVSECSYYSSETYPYTCEVWDNECEAQNCYFKQFKRARAEIEELKSDIESRTMCITCERELQNYNLQAENERLKLELKKYEDMAKKGLEEFKDVGGCWGCGLQLQLNQDMEDIKQLKAENERLKSIVESNNQQVEQAELLVMDNDRLQQEVENLKDTIYYDVEKYRQTLQEIKDIVSEQCQQCLIDGFTKPDDCGICDYKRILDKINKVIGAE